MLNYKLGLIFVLIISFSFMSSATNAQDKKGIICNQEYVLCTSAPCVPDPNNPDTKAVCDCEVRKGKNYGYSTCKERQAQTKSGNIKLVLSTYSFSQFTSKLTMVCESGKPWTDCLDQACTVDPMNRLRAICSCKIKRTGKFVTLGGSCNAITCGKGYWSGATVSDDKNNQVIFSKALGLPKVPDNYCPQVTRKTLQ